MMKKNFILPLLAAASLTGVAQGALSDEQGNWSIMVSLNTEALSDLFKSEPEKDEDDTGDYQYSPEVVESANIVSWSGSSTYAYGGQAVLYNGTKAHNSERNYGKTIGSVQDRTVSYWIGWGDAWYERQESGMRQGLQMGFAEGSTANIYTTPEPNLSDGFFGIGNKGHYRGDTKLDTDGDFLQDDNNDGAPMSSLKDYLENYSISSATLAIVHSNENGTGTNQYGTHCESNYVGETNSWGVQTQSLNGKAYEFTGKTAAHSQTLQYLTITFENEDGEKITITYIAEVDDGGSVSPDETLTSSIAPSSNRYDVDILNKVDFNFDYVDGYKVIAEALTPEEVKGFNDFIMVPEPASATLSMVALSALCARRRRRK